MLATNSASDSGGITQYSISEKRPTATISCDRALANFLARGLADHPPITDGRSSMTLNRSIRIVGVLNWSSRSIGSPFGSALPPQNKKMIRKSIVNALGIFALIPGLGISVRLV
jgi:hypothetical protein